MMPPLSLGFSGGTAVSGTGEQRLDGSGWEVATGNACAMGGAQNWIVPLLLVAVVVFVARKK